MPHLHEGLPKALPPFPDQSTGPSPGRPWGTECRLGQGKVPWARKGSSQTSASPLFTRTSRSSLPCEGDFLGAPSWTCGEAQLSAGESTPHTLRAPAPGTGRTTTAPTPGVASGGGRGQVHLGPGANHGGFTGPRGQQGKAEVLPSELLSEPGAAAHTCNPSCSGG